MITSVLWKTKLENNLKLSLFYPFVADKEPIS